MTTAPRCRLPASVFAGLAAGHGGPDAIRRLRLVNRSKTLLAIRLLAAETVRQAHAAAPVVAEAYRVLGELRVRAPDAADRVLDDPAVGMWAIGTARGMAGSTPVARPGALAQVAAAVAVRAGLPADLPVPEGPELRLPSLGTVRVSGTAVRIRPDDEGVTVAGGGASVRIPAAFEEPASGWRPMVVAAVGERRVPLEDWAFTPLPTHFPAEPAHVSPGEASGWSEVLTAGVDLLARHELADTITEAVLSIGPLRGLRSSQQNSATLAEAFGCVLLTPPADARSAAVTLVHEVQHSKLAALLDLVPLLEETGTPQRFYAPWRPDPRPLLGLLHGSYAHLGVAGFWRRQRLLEPDPDAALAAETEFVRWRQATEETVDIIVSRPELTRHGQEFTVRMAETLATWSAEPVSSAARAAASRLNHDHRARWR